MPELATSLVVALRREPDIAIGNFVGSNIFNILGILGVASMLPPFHAPGISVLAYGAMVIFTVLLIPLLFTGRLLHRLEGAYVSVRSRGLRAGRSWACDRDLVALRHRQYVWILLDPSEYEAAYLDQCPEHYREHEDFWLTTVRTIIHDTENGDPADLSLALAIDMLWPCHWRFVENLQIVLEAIGGRLSPAKPFAACSRNITLVPMRRRMETISNTLKTFCGSADSSQEVHP